MLCCSPKLPLPVRFRHLPEDDRATAIGNMHKTLGKDRACRSGDIIADRQTHTHTDILITILRNRSRGRSNNNYYRLVCCIESENSTENNGFMTTAVLLATLACI